MSVLGYVLLAFTPGLFWLWFFVRGRAYRPKPRRLLVFAFFLGMLSTIPAGTLNTLFIDPRGAGRHGRRGRSRCGDAVRGRPGGGTQQILGGAPWPVPVSLLRRTSRRAGVCGSGQPRVCFSGELRLHPFLRTRGDDRARPCQHAGPRHLRQLLGLRAGNTGAGRKAWAVVVAARWVGVRGGGPRVVQHFRVDLLHGGNTAGVAAGCAGVVVDAQPLSLGPAHLAIPVAPQLPPGRMPGLSAAHLHHEPFLPVLSVAGLVDDANVVAHLQPLRPFGAPRC